MKTVVSILLVFTFFSTVSQARDTRGKYDINEALSSPSGKSVLDKNIKLYWAKQKSPKVKQDMGLIKTNKKTNAFNKSDKEACHWVFLSAVKQLQQRAKSMGADAVINIKSNYKNQVHESAEIFECGAGSLIAGVALMGTAVKLSKAAPKKKTEGN